jgi:hypothetical protein
MNAPSEPLVPGVNVRFIRHPGRQQERVAGTPFQVWSQPEQTVWTLFFHRGDDYFLRFPGFADFAVSGDGKQVECWPAPDTPGGTVSHLYLNQVMPLALSRQGRLVLHGSGVSLNGSGFVFLGRSGRGKSTMAAAFAKSGARFLTDDGVLLEWADGTLLVLPSHPSIRLWDDSRRALVEEHPHVAPAVSYTSKQRFLAGTDLPFCDEAQPVRRMFLLGEGTSGAIILRQCSASEAVMGMVSNSFLLDIAEKEMLARHFDDIGVIANLPIHYHLDYPRRYEDLHRVREAVVRHAFEECPE